MEEEAEVVVEAEGEDLARVVEDTVDHLTMLLKVVSRLPVVVVVVIIMGDIIPEEAPVRHMVGVGVGVTQVAFHMGIEGAVVQLHSLYPRPLVFTYLHPPGPLPLRVQGVQALHMMIGAPLEEERFIVEDSRA